MTVSTIRSSLSSARISSPPGKGSFTMQRRVGPLLLLLLLTAAASSLMLVHAAEEEQTCVMNEDGTQACVSEEENATSDDASCVDEHDQCEYWASLGECTANPPYMWRHCRKSCETCSIPLKEIDRKAAEFVGKADGGDGGKDEAAEEETANVEETEWGVAQLAEGNNADKTNAIIAETEEYMRNVVFQDPKYENVRSECKNRNKQCAFWASIGECEANPAYMNLQCAPSCKSCDQLDFDNRCPFDRDAPTALTPGALNHLFERLTTDPVYSQYKPVIHSRPAPTERAKNGDENVPEPKEGPWVVTLEDFVTPEECERLIKLGGDRGYLISEDVGKKKFDGTYESYKNAGRTSTNAWCVEECYEDPATQRVIERIENITGIPDANSEYLQLLRYEKTQKYQIHHDYIEHHVDRSQGVRILTVYLYLSEVEEGGGTNFPKLDITVQPKVGKALIWPSVLDSNPNAKDARTDHQALPVIKGVKYGANAWIHQRDFKEPYKRSCI